MLDAKSLVRDAISKIANQDYIGGIYACHKALAIDRDYAKAYYWRGVAHEEHGDKDRAIADYEQAIATSERGYISAYIRLARLWWRERKRDKALDCYQQAIELEVDRQKKASIAIEYARLRLELKQAGYALDLLNEAIIDFPCPEAYQQRAKVYQQLGEAERATADLARSMTILSQTHDLP